MPTTRPSTYPKSLSRVHPLEKNEIATEWTWWIRGSLCELDLKLFAARSVSASDLQSCQIAAPQINALATARIQGIIPVKRGLFCQYGLPI